MKGKRCARVPLRLLVTFLLFGSVGSFILGQELGHNFSIVPVYAAQSFMFSGAGITAALTTPIQAAGALGSPTPTTSGKTHPQVKPPVKPPVNRPPAKPTATNPAPSGHPGVVPGSPDSTAPAPAPIAPGPAAPPMSRCATTPCGPAVDPVLPVRQPPAGPGKDSNGAPSPLAPDDSAGQKNAPGTNRPDGSSLAESDSPSDGAPSSLSCPASRPAPSGLVTGVSPSLSSMRVSSASTAPCLAHKPAKKAPGSKLPSTTWSNPASAQNQPIQLLVLPQPPAPVTPGAPDATSVQAPAEPIQTPTQQSMAPITSAEPDAPNAQGVQSSAATAPQDDDPAQVAPIAP